MIMSKKRLYEVSKGLGITTKTARDFLKANGYLVKNNMKILSDGEIELLRHLSPDCTSPLSSSETDMIQSLFGRENENG